MILTTFAILLSFPDLATTSKGVDGGGARSGGLDCVKANEQCLKEAACSTKYRTMRQCVAGRHSSSLSAVTAPEAQGECRSAMDAIKHNPLNGCRCRRGMKKEKNCLRIFWSIYQSLQGNDLLEYSPYEPVNSRLSDVFRLAPIIAAEPASSKENNCLNAAKACNLNDTCKKYRSAYINPCTGRVSASEVCNKRKCHKALRHFFDKVPSKYSYGMLFCSCPTGDETACAERRRQTIVPACSYEDKDKSNCLSLQNACKTNYICRSRLADFISSCQPETRSVSGCLRENYADCLLAYSGLIGTVITPNYERSLGISPSPWCDCVSSGNDKPECDKFLNFFTDNRCLRNAIQAFGNGTDVGVWQPPVEPTSAQTKDDDKPDLHADPSYQFCGTLQAQKLASNRTEDSTLCETGDSNAIARSSSREVPRAYNSRLLFALTLAPTFQLVGITFL
ncbi:GDNF family receptor alpha-1b [Corythoichthys intestinalis]|uniref:GDNF family receptor alpha-1b n=1 Tax=Corythoichthys intestinalis TaxID=161448 RepID=UPI0025A50046|nr:GDNF family receptor alpha-1b [Corythoichthys intestinalis]XP_061807775.1 GDNF family receptor alpha-1-like [Nerophis lumbriciformis]